MHANKGHALENYLSEKEWYFEFDESTSTLIQLPKAESLDNG
jgi:hypothetical protein